MKSPEDAVRELQGILEQSGLGLITGPPKAAPEPPVTRAGSRGSWVVGSHMPASQDFTVRLPVSSHFLFISVCKALLRLGPCRAH